MHVSVVQRGIPGISGDIGIVITLVVGNIAVYHFAIIKRVTILASVLVSSCRSLLGELLNCSEDM